MTRTQRRLHDARAGRILALAVSIGLLSALPADAAGVGVSLPKLQVLELNGHSVGGSVQVLGTTLSLGVLRATLELDYAYTRNFQTSANYSFFDGGAGLGLPLRLTPQTYLVPGLEAHALWMVASPESVQAIASGWGPAVTLGFRPSRQIEVEVGASVVMFPSLQGAQRTYRGNLSTVQLGGRYLF